MDKRLTETVKMSPAEANGASMALDTLTRLGLGQMDCVEWRIRDEILLMRANDGYREAALETCDRARYLMNRFQNGLGFDTNASFGIFNKEVPLVAQRAWEIKKVLDKVLAEDRDPNPTFRGVNYDGITVRTTKDAIPGVELRHSKEGGALAEVVLYLSADQKEALKKAVSVTQDLMEARYEVLPELVEEGAIPFNNETHFGCEPQKLPYFQELAKALSQEMRSPLKHDKSEYRAEKGIALPSL